MPRRAAQAAGGGGRRGATSCGAADAAHWRARKARAEALLAERRLAELSGRLVPREALVRAVQSLAASVVDEVRSKPLLASEAIAAILPALPEPQQHLLRAAVRDWEADVLRRLASEAPARALRALAADVSAASVDEGAPADG